MQRRPLAVGLLNDDRPVYGGLFGVRHRRRRPSAIAGRRRLTRGTAARTRCAWSARIDLLGLGRGQVLGERRLRSVPRLGGRRHERGGATGGQCADWVRDGVFVDNIRAVRRESTANAAHWLSGNDAPDHFYVITPAETAYYHFSTCGSDYDTMLYLYDVVDYEADTCLRSPAPHAGAVSLIGEWDDPGKEECMSTGSRENLEDVWTSQPLQAGETYVLQVTGFSDRGVVTPTTRATRARRATTYSPSDVVRNGTTGGRRTAVASDYCTSWATTAAPRYWGEPATCSNGYSVAAEPAWARRRVHVLPDRAPAAHAPDCGGDGDEDVNATDTPDVRWLGRSPMPRATPPSTRDGGRWVETAPGRGLVGGAASPGCTPLGDVAASMEWGEPATCSNGYTPDAGSTMHDSEYTCCPSATSCRARRPAVRPRGASPIQPPRQCWAWQTGSSRWA